MIPLREQTAVVRVATQWDCCATIEFEVYRKGARPAVGLPNLDVETRTPDTGDADAFFQLLLFLDDGWLETLELVHCGKHPPTEFPTVAAFEPPSVRQVG